MRWNGIVSLLKIFAWNCAKVAAGLSFLLGLVFSGLTLVAAHSLPMFLLGFAGIVMLGALAVMVIENLF